LPRVAVEHAQEAGAGQQREPAGEPREHVVVEYRLVGQVAHAAHHLGALLEAVEARDARRAAGGPQHAHKHLHGGGLAGAVGAEQAEHLALLDGEREVAHGDEVAVGLGEGTYLHHAAGVHEKANDTRSN
jgi:hypothetical protein